MTGFTNDIEKLGELHERIGEAVKECSRKLDGPNKDKWQRRAQWLLMARTLISQAASNLRRADKEL